ncbi:MAG: hypothetical protein QOJ65_2342, partial [Fimbriimonadaceae bacterium]|nr:hypothetical protein [Fimbriimonadaceae bacterium]
EKMVEAEAEDLAETERKAAESSTPTP